MGVQCVVKVEHDGRAKMVGKVYTHTERQSRPIGPRLIFFHEEVNGDQTHRTFDSPGGLDVAVVDALDAWGVTHVYHYRRSARDLYIATLADVRAFGIRSTSAGRTRLFLPFARWEKRRGAFDTPFIRGEHVIRPAVPTQERMAL